LRLTESPADDGAFAAPGMGTLLLIKMGKVAPRVENERLDLLDALIYGDVFDCAVTLDELWQYSRVAIDRDELCRRLRADPVLRHIVVEENGLYCLNGRTALLDQRPRRILRAHRLQRRARLVARALRHLPFVRGLVLTGSTSADDATEGADIDLLVIAAAGRIGTVFLLLGPLSRLLGRWLFCPNWYMREDCLGSTQENLYIAREFTQARSLVGNADALRGSNPWIAEAFPNAVAPPALEPGLKKRTILQRLLEAPFRGILGDGLERAALRVAAARLRAHYAAFGNDVPGQVAASFESGVALGFHGYCYERTTLKAYEDRRAQLLDRLERVQAAVVTGTA
jgi:predicted nucleotidyltransferase